MLSALPVLYPDNVTAKEREPSMLYGGMWPKASRPVAPSISQIIAAQQVTSIAPLKHDVDKDASAFSTPTQSSRPCLQVYGLRTLIADKCATNSDHRSERLPR